MSERTFAQDDLTAFAHLSGDFNPIHTDPVQARRFVFNSTVAHGISVLLWALDCAVRPRNETLRIQSLRARFLKPVRAGERVGCSVRAETDEGTVIEVRRRTELAARIEVRFSSVPLARKGNLSGDDPDRLECRVSMIHELAEARGQVPLHLNPRRFASLYPLLSKRIDPTQVSQLLATTRVVGMECPGLHSVYSALDLDFTEREGDGSALEYEVTVADERMGRIEIGVRSENLRGELVAYVRPPPSEQADFETLKRLLIEGEFESQRALVVGGSRGIGAVAAKLLAGGGAEVHLTFSQGKEEAEGIVREITAHGGKASSSRLNVLERIHHMLQEPVKGQPTHLYYFASPAIFVGAHNEFSPSVFSRFCDFYVGGLVNVLAAVMTGALRGLFFPSSVAVEELPANMGEYVAAKAAGEALCRLLGKWYPRLVVACPRLPRTRTDQTVSLLGESSPAPQDVILPHLRWLHGATREQKSLG